MSGKIFEIFVISEILKSYSNGGWDYKYHVGIYSAFQRIEAVAMQQPQTYFIRTLSKQFSYFACSRASVTVVISHTSVGP